MVSLNPTEQKYARANQDSTLTQTHRSTAKRRNIPVNQNNSPQDTNTLPHTDSDAPTTQAEIYRGRLSGSLKVGGNDYNPEELPNILPSLPSREMVKVSAAYCVAALVGISFLSFFAFVVGWSLSLVLMKSSKSPMLMVAEVRKTNSLPTQSRMHSSIDLPASSYHISNSLLRDTTTPSAVFGDVMGSSITLTSKESYQGATIYLTITNQNHIEFQLDNIALMITSSQKIISSSESRSAVQEANVVTQLSCVPQTIPKKGDTKFSVRCFMPPNLNVKNGLFKLLYRGKEIDSGDLLRAKISYSSGAEVIREVHVKKSMFSYDSCLKKLASTLQVDTKQINIVSLQSSSPDDSYVVSYEIISEESLDDSTVEDRIKKNPEFIAPSPKGKSVHCDACQGICMSAPDVVK